MNGIFSCTSVDPYDRHNYEIVLKNGEKRFFKHWEDAQAYWFMNRDIPDFLDVIVVRDKKKARSKGFAP